MSQEFRTAQQQVKKMAWVKARRARKLADQSLERRKIFRAWTEEDVTSQIIEETPETKMRIGT